MPRVLKSFAVLAFLSALAVAGPRLSWGASSRIFPASYTEYTVCPSGCDFSSIGLAEVTTTVDLGAAGGIVVTVSLGTYDERVTISGATNGSAENYRVFRGASRTNRPLVAYSGGIGFFVGVGVLQVNADYGEPVTEQWVCLYDFDVTYTGTTTNNLAGVYTTIAGQGRFVGLWVHDVTSPAAGAAYGIWMNSPGNTVINCIAARNKLANFYTSDDDNVFYNCTSYDATERDFFKDVGASTGSAINCIAQESQIPGFTYSGAAWTALTDCLVDAPVLFVDAAGDDFRLQEDDTAAKDQGTDESAIYTDDYAGTTRPYGAAFDIGAYEWIPGGAAWPHLIQWW